MRAKNPKMNLRWLAAVAVGMGIFATMNLQAAFIYESSTEFFSAGDFNGDGIADVLVLDKATGNARAGYSDGNGGLTWSAPLVTGLKNVTGLGVEHFLAGTNDSIAVTAPDFNRVNLVDLSQTNTAGTPHSFATVGIGPHAVAGLASPLTPPAGGLSFLLVASSFNNAPAEKLDLIQWSGTPFYAGLFNEIYPFVRLNELTLNTNTATLAVGLARGATNDALHVWQFTNAPAALLVFSNLPSGSDYTFVGFNGEPLPRFIFYRPGDSNLTVIPLLQTNAALAWGLPLNLPLSEGVEGVFAVNLGTNAGVIVQFSDGVQILTLPDGSPRLSAKYQTGAEVAGNVFTGVVPLTNGMFAFLDAPAGAASSTHAQVIQFDGTNFILRGSSSLPPVSSRRTRANVWLFKSEPFVNRSPGFIASFNSPDWADGVMGLPGAIQVPSESDAGTAGGLGNVSTNNLATPPGNPMFGLANQYNPAISVFTYGAPQAAEPVQVTISPPPGAYGSPQTISFDATPTGSQVQYRVNGSDSWHAYTATFSISNDCTVQYYGTGTLGVRGGLQFASYSFGSPIAAGTNQPIPVNPDNTNRVTALSTNQLILSQNGTVFYGRRSAAGDGTIWAINLDGSGDTYITTGARPRVTTDGRWLAFLREGNPFNNQGNLWIRDLESGAEQRLLQNPMSTIAGYDWEPNEAALLTDYGCEIWDLNTNGTLSALINADCSDKSPVRNPVDGRIAFHNLNLYSSMAGLYVANADGSGRHRIVSSVPGASWPAWSPDGGDLVFADSNNNGQNAGKNLWLVYPDGSGLLQISGFTDGTNGFPHGAIWSPDDSTLVAAGTIFGTNGLWLIPLTADHTECDGEPVRLPTSPGDAIDFAGSVVVAPPTGSFASTTAPGLFIRQTAEAVVVYWSTNSVGFVLEAESSLSPNAWASVSGPYFRSGQYFEHWETRDNLLTQEYFRLRAPGGFVVSQPPALTIHLQDNIVVLSWPTQPSGFKLQSKTSLSPGVLWSDVNGQILINGSNYEYHEPVAAAQDRQFRLRGP